MSIERRRQGDLAKGLITGLALAFAAGPASAGDDTARPAQNAAPADSCIALSSLSDLVAGRRPAALFDTDPFHLVIDAGHGGRDPGAVLPQAAGNEKDVTLHVATELAAALSDDDAIHVSLIREADVYVDLAERVRRANSFAPSLLISLHTGATDGAYAPPISIRVLSEDGRRRFDDALQARGVDRPADYWARRSAAEALFITELLDASDSTPLAGASGDADSGASAGSCTVQARNYYVLSADAPSVLIELAGDGIHAPGAEALNEIVAQIARAVRALAED